MIDFDQVEQTDQSIKVVRKARYADSKLIAPLEKSFQDGLDGKPNVLRITVDKADEKEALAEIRGAIEVMDNAFQSAGNASGDVRGIGKRVSTEETDGKVVILFAAVPKSARGPKGPRKPKENGENGAVNGAANSSQDSAAKDEVKSNVPAKTAHPAARKNAPVKA